MRQKGFVQVLILVIIVAIAGYFVFRYYQLKNKIIVFPIPLTSATPVATTDPTTDWKTYTNSQYGFELKYPQDYKIQSGSKNNNYCLILSRVSDGPDMCLMFINIFPNSKNLSLTEFVQIPEFKQFFWSSSNQFPKYSALAYDKTNFLVLSPDKNFVINFQLAGFGDLENQILSTFQFTK